MGPHGQVVGGTLSSPGYEGAQVLLLDQCPSLGDGLEDPPQGSAMGT